MRRVGLVICVLTVVAGFGATSASAATEFGNPCAGNEITESPNTYFPFAASGDPLPLAAPSAGVITRWKMNSQIPATFQQTLKVVRQNGPKTVQIVGESPGTISFGTSSFETRIPVQAGDLLGVFGTSQTIEGTPIGNLFCLLPGTSEVAVGAFPGAGGGPGSTNEFVLIEAEAGFPITAVLEPDADNDGYGDETQDKCPQSAASQAACPPPPAPVALSTSSITKKNLVSILVTANSQATVTVVGMVKVGKGKPVSLNGGTQIVAPGALAQFTLLFPKKLTAKLKQLSPKQSLTLDVTATAPNASGAASISKLKVKLKGQGNASRHKKRRAKGHA
jgi:hypothetical protein